MNQDNAKEILDELFSSIESVEAQSLGVLQFLKGKGLASDEELAPYLDQAKTSASVRCVAARARIDRLVESAFNDVSQEVAQSTPPGAPANKPDETKDETTKDTSERKQTGVSEETENAIADGQTSDDPQPDSKRKQTSHENAA